MENKEIGETKRKYLVATKPYSPPRGTYTASCRRVDRDECFKTLREAKEEMGLKVPFKVLLHLQRKKILWEPVYVHHIEFLYLLNLIWKDRMVIRSQIANLPKSERKSMLATSDLPTKWQRYAYSRFFNDKPIQGQAPTIRIVERELIDYFGTKINKDVTKELKRLQRSARNKRHYEGQRTAVQDESSDFL